MYNGLGQYLYLEVIIWAKMVRTNPKKEVKMRKGTKGKNPKPLIWNQIGLPQWVTRWKVTSNFVNC